jgi:predicted lipoprotein with Yx(FWY)xxD motif
VQRSKRILLGIGVGVAALGSGIGFAAASSSSSTAAPTRAAQAGPAPVSQAPASLTPAGPAPAGPATINVTSASVGGKTEQVLVDAHGLPLYIYGADTTATSKVSGRLAALWPPLVSSSPTESGATGKLTVLTDANGQQVQYNGHFLYTFVDDTPGQVTGEGVQNFFVATPSLGSPTTTRPPAPASNQGGGYGY